MYMWRNLKIHTACRYDYIFYFYLHAYGAKNGFAQSTNHGLAVQSLQQKYSSNQSLISQQIFKSIVKSTHDFTVKSSALDLRLILL